MATGNWWVVYAGKRIGLAHQARKPKAIAKGPFSSRGAALTAARSALRRKQNPGRPRRTKKRMRTMGAMKFFQQHAGGVVGRNAEIALVLARAEQYAKRHGWRVVWTEDPEPDLSWASPEQREQIREVLIATLTDGKEPPRGPNTLASLGGIVDPDRNYMRVIEAELASEAAPGRSLSRSNPSKLTAGDVSVTKLHNGAWEVAAVWDGYRQHQTYYGYSKKDAIRAFVEHVNAQPNSRGLRRENPTPSKRARAFIGRKIRRLAHEGMEAPRRIAAAYGMARERGFSVPRSNPDRSAERSTQRFDDLEKMVDFSSVSEVLDSLARVCYEKEEHVQSNWQDSALAKKWKLAGAICAVAAGKVGV